MLEEFARVVGAENVLVAPSQRTCYAADFYPGERHLPAAVVVPRRVVEVPAVVRLAYRYGLPLVPRGSGTSVTGGVVPVRGGLILDLSRLNHVLRVDAPNLYAVLEPGVVWADLNRALAGHGLFTPATPGSGRVSTVGGSVACGGSGMRSLKYGTVREQVLALTVVLPGGEAIHLGSRTAKTACGYALKDLFIGAEGTLGVITEVTLKLWPRPAATVVVEAELEALEEATTALGVLRREGMTPAAYELVPAATLRLAGRADFPAAGLLMAEFDGAEAEVDRAGARLGQLLRGPRWVWADAAARADAWRRFGEIYFCLARLKPSPVAEDVGVPVAEVPRALRLLEELFRSHGVEAGLMSHAGDGTIHCVLSADREDAAAWAQVRAARAALYRLVLELGGTLTTEHGLGISRAPFARWQLGGAQRLMRQIKQAVDPQNLMNPGKMGLEPAAGEDAG